MSRVQIIRVQDLTKQQLDDFEAIFVLDMSDAPAIISICGGNRDLIGPMGRGIILAATLGGEIYAATAESGEIVGFAVWMPPGQEILSTPEQRKLGWDDFWSKLSEEGKDWFTNTGKQDSWYLILLMVHPNYQGQGIARKIVDIVRKKASMQGSMMALSTSQPRNIPIYEALDFELRGNKIIPSPWGDWPSYVFTQDTGKTS
ncbi:hypothetical protein DAEQUDRAFT_201698 [Daedalea quercina L-15889]|uniref:N-acetyltransferase domain-containing protein n=1 Tax=Daedalea quercina L-15889 TaxID=1314783 RepID=A0A165UA66_9APHY|nr:hypothetical protein DAEQUDRAFT_201698 [Daedalea quercina L-15889]